MRYLVVLRGLPGAGKTTFIQKHGLKDYTLSSDKYRLSLCSPTFDLDGKLVINQDINHLAWEYLYTDLEYRMENGEFTIVDATHITKKSIDKYKQLCKKYFYRLIVVEFKTNSFMCIKNDFCRQYSVGEDVIHKMAINWEELSNSIVKVNPNDLQEELESRYQPLDFNNKKIHVIGDIHGCYTALKVFIDNNVDLDNDIIIFVGDYFDRGSENARLFPFLYNIKDKPNVFMCIGNHEKTIMRYLWGVGASTSRFCRETLKQLQANDVTDKMLRSFIRALIPCVYFNHGDKEYIVSHGGITTPFVNVFMPESMFVNGIGTYEDMNKVCDTFSKFNSTIQIFGHRNNDDVPIKINNNCYNVCGFPEYGGDLKAITIENGEIKTHYINNNVFSREGYYNAINRYPNRFKIELVQDLVGAFRHNKYVKETGFEGISSFQFTPDAFYEGHWNTIVNHARGLFINIRTFEIVARSYDKFFLLDQYDYCTLDRFEAPFKVYKKYDGFLGILGYDSESDSLLYCSKSTLAPYGDYANLFKAKIQPLIKDEQCLKWFLKDNNCSMVFECIAPKEDEHIIKYDSDRIILLDIVRRNIKFERITASYTKHYFYNVEQKEFIGKYKELPITKLKGTEGEGYVITDRNNKMFKLKTYEYEAGKILRNIRDIYTKIKEQALGHDIKCPSEAKIKERYCKYYSDIVVDKVIKEVPKIIANINKGDM